MSRPNIILIMSDEHDPAVMGCYGDRLNPTPHLDSLAAGGVVFENAYTTSPLCLPARLSFTAGKYVSRISAWTNTCRLPSADYPSIATTMNGAGYRSYLCGKMHYTDQFRYGFEELFPYRGNAKPSTGKGGRRDPADRTANRAQWDARAATFRAVPDEEPFRVDATHECDARITEEAVRFLRGPAAQRDPFFLVVGYHAPHFPMDVPRSWYEKFRGRVPPPWVPAGHVESLPLNYRHRNLIHGVTPDISADVIQRGRECYWALTAWFDHEVGKVLQAIREQPFAENTAILYTSDHGENKGDHGMWWKSCMFEPSARIPLIAHWPRRWKGGQRRRGACSLVDLTRTVAGLGETEVPADWNGESLLPWLDDERHPWRDRAVSEFYASGVSGYAMVRQGRYKYVYHTRACESAPPERELYDLETDPGEFHNLAADESRAALIGRLHEVLVREVGRDPEEIERQAREELARGYGPDPGVPGEKRS